jgi:hypothetical protein
MGNFSRNTFDPTRNYVGVRLQQGVPLVDADWNEMDDAIRNEIYSGFAQLFPDGIQPGTQDLLISPTSPVANNFTMGAGAVLAGARPLRVPAAITYNAQPWFNNPARAAQDGVAVIPPLTLPTANRTDLVFLDVWEREVRSAEDTSLINPAIGVETCVRVKRDFAVRVAEGIQTLPAAAAGHSFVPLAFLNRFAGQTVIAIGNIEDIRPRLFSTRGPRSISFVPTFFPYGSTTTTWFFDNGFQGGRCQTPLGVGVLPLVLPEGATLLSVRIQGNSAEVYFTLWRHQNPGFIQFEQVFNGSFVLPSGSLPVDFESVFPIPSAFRFNVVDNTRCNYFLTVQCGQQRTIIQKVVVNCQY